MTRQAAVPVKVINTAAMMTRDDGPPEAYDLSQRQLQPKKTMPSRRIGLAAMANPESRLLERESYCAR